MFKRNTLLQFVTTIFSILYFTGIQVDGSIHDAFEPTALEAEWVQRHRVSLRHSGYRDLACEKPDVYICEEPDSLLPTEHTKTCNYRSVRYPEQVYRWVAGRGCLLFTPDFLYVAGYNNINLNSACLYGQQWAPCIEMTKNDGTCGCFPFDPAFEEVARLVRDSLVPGAHGRWERCFYEASDCCSHHMSHEVVSDPDHCETTFDGWTCWDRVESNTVATAVCSEFAYSISGPSCHHYSTKQCFSNGTWEIQTDYSTCSITSRLLRRYRFHIVVLSISIACCLPAVFIFFFYKRLRITRVSLHRNLLIVIITRNVLVIVSRSTVYIDELTTAGDTVMSTHGYPCRVLAIAERIAANCVFVAMLVEGVYMHRTIVAVFKKKLNVNWLYGIGAVIAILPVVAWGIVMGYLNNHSCWFVYTVENIQWILDGPRILILLINCILFIDVLRVLLTKIRNNENANQLNTTKATLFLMPIFGTQFLLTALRPSTTDCIAEQIYYYVFYTLEGLQGFTVALLYCYVNKEVQMLIKATYKKTETAVTSRMRRDSSYTRASNAQPDRRITYSTELPPEQADKETYQPKLHVAEIISIRATERLAEILEPVYETVQTATVNEGYDGIDRSDRASYLSNRPNDDYYAFTNASSVSLDCDDWIRCVSSPPSSIYNNSLNGYEAKYSERKFPKHSKMPLASASVDKLDKDGVVKNIGADMKTDDAVNTNSTIGDSHNMDSETKDTIKEEEEYLPEFPNALELGIDGEMIHEIMHYMETKNKEAPVRLKAESLCPNRKDEDAIIFV